MRLLIVEDNTAKLHNIKDYLNKFPEIDVHDAVSYTAAIRRLQNENWDVLILDMTLPMYDPGKNRDQMKSMGAKDIIVRLSHRKQFIPSIIVTRFDSFGEKPTTIEEINQELSKSFRDVWKGTVHYDETTDEWKEELTSYIEAILRDR